MPKILSTPSWKKSSRCESSACVEVAFAEEHAVLLRDSKEAEGPILTFSAPQWTSFVTALRSGTFTAE